MRPDDDDSEKMSSSFINPSLTDSQSTQSDDQLTSVMSKLMTMISGLKAQIQVKVADIQKANAVHATFGNHQNGKQLSLQQKDEVAGLFDQLRAEQNVPLDHILVVIKHVLHVKTQNLAMQAHLKNMEALL